MHIPAVPNNRVNVQYLGITWCDQRDGGDKTSREMVNSFQAIQNRQISNFLFCPPVSLTDVHIVSFHKGLK